MSKHTPGPWKQGDTYRASIMGSDDHIVADALTRRPQDEREANARLIAAAPELLEELSKAHRIIENALNCGMTIEQKDKWAQLNGRDDVMDGPAVTRSSIRLMLIAKAVEKP